MLAGEAARETLRVREAVVKTVTAAVEARARQAASGEPAAAG